METQMGIISHSSVAGRALIIWLLLSFSLSGQQQTVVVLAANELNQSFATSIGQQQQQSLRQQTSGCDLLFMVGDNLANYCHCKDATPTGDLEAPSSAGSGFAKPAQINLLSCTPTNFSQIIRDLFLLQHHYESTEVLPHSATAAPTPPLTFQIDYLNINTTLTSRLNFPIPSNSSSATALTANLMLIDHISIQLNQLQCKPNENDDDEDRTTTKSNDQIENEDQLTIEQQMIDFTLLINEAHLQFLSIFLTSQCQLTAKRTTKTTTTTTKKKSNNFRLERLLARLSNLARFELQSSPDYGPLYLGADCFAHQRHSLKWINLNSNAELTFPSANTAKSSPISSSPFAFTPHLEYLSLEANHLTSFPLFSLLATNQLMSTNQQQQSFQSTQSNRYYGLANLSSLNLASNELSSFENDLFTQENDTQHNHQVTTACQVAKPLSTASSSSPIKLFLLPSLTQLDLSSNKLRDISHKAAQHILCSMPNLNQLFLQRNRIFHLNLNSLLTFPAQPQLINYLEANHSSVDIAKPIQQQSHQSKLEYIDLSYNNLIRLTATQPQTSHSAILNSKSSTVRVKTIDLSHNNLRKPLLPIDSQLINRVLFVESFHSIDHIHYHHQQPKSKFNTTANNIDLLESSFIVHDNTSNWLSLCDFLSPGDATNHQAVGSGNKQLSALTGELLNEVILSNNQLNRLAKIDFSSLQCKDLQVLRLRQNSITYIEHNSLNMLINLEQLDISLNYLKSLPEKIFEKNKHLKVLNLSKNRLRSLSREIFFNLLDLEEIYLEENELYSLSSELFSFSRNLNIINLSKNKLTNLDKHTFSYSPNLKVLILNDNHFKRFTHHLFEAIIISTPQIDTHFKQQLNRDARKPVSLKQQQQLLSRKSSSNQHKLLKTIANQSNKRRTNRQVNDNEQESNVLIISHNQIDQFKFEMCNDINQQSTAFTINVQSLWLNDNRLKEINEITFKCFASLKRLYLSNNRLRSFDKTLFKPLTQLEHLDLSHNQLVSIQNSAFTHSNNLKGLDLSHNSLLELNLMDVFTIATTDESNRYNNDEPLHQLEYLSLSDNSNLIIQCPHLYTFLSKVHSLRRLEMSNINQSKCVQNNNNVTLKERIYLESLSARWSSLTGNGQIIESIELLLNEPHVIIERLNLNFDALQLTSSGDFDKVMSSLRVRLATNELSELDLSGNQLSSSQSMAIFQELPDVDNRRQQAQVTYLNLSSNLIDQWPFNISNTNKMSRLHSLDLSQNKIRVLIRGNSGHLLFGYQLPELLSLNLSFNLISSLIEEHHEQQTTKLASLMPQLNQLDLSFNRLTWIPEFFFRDLNQLSHLRLDHNLIESFVPEFSWHRKNVYLDLSFNQKLIDLIPNQQLMMDLDTNSAHYSEPQIAFKDTISLMNSNNVIFFRRINHSSSSKLNCLSIYEYIESQRDSPVTSPVEQLEFEVAQIESYQDEQISQHQNDNNEQCEHISNSISFYKLDSISAHLRIDQLSTLRAGSYLAVSFRANSLNQLEVSKAPNQQIVALDYSQNKIQSLPSSWCLSYPNLLSLSLNENQLTSLPEVILRCVSLRYLDLSFNKINSISLELSNINSTMSSITVLKLDHNMLKNLDVHDLSRFNELRFIDLRYNQLQVSNSWLRVPLSFVALVNGDDDHHKLGNHFQYLGQQEEVEDVIKPMLRVNQQEESLTINIPSALGGKFAIYHNNNKQLIEVGNKTSRKHVIRFCTIETQNPIEVCLKSLTLNLFEDGCLHLKRPPNLPLCLTNLQEIGNLVSNSSNSTTVFTANSNKLQSADKTSYLLSSGSVEEKSNEGDPVLTFINTLKLNWLKLKEFNLNEYLSSLSDIRADSVWIKLADKYPVYTLTIVKVAMVCGSICIIALLIAMFSLLTYLSSSQVNRSTCSHHRKANNQRCESNCDATTCDTDTSRSSATTTNNSDSRTQSSGFASTSSSSSTSMMINNNNTTNTNHQIGSKMSNSRSASNTSRDETTQQLTVIENNRLLSYQQHQQQQQQQHETNTCLQQLDTNQLAQSIQPSSTPSLSIAPSSIETAETLQAIDSIQSGNSIYNGSNTGKTSIDQYCDQVNVTPTFVTQQQQPQVATVMRMVKSSSANFDSAAKRQQIVANSHLYGTLNSARYPNCPTLKSRIRTMHESQSTYSASQQRRQQQQQQPVLGYYSQEQLQQVTAANSNQPQVNYYVEPIRQQQQQDLDPTTMSLLSINSAVSGGANFAANLPQTDQQFPLPPPVTSNLCNYHRYAQQQDAENFSSDVILEQEEDQSVGNLMLVANLPPPPPSRVIEALESHHQYLSGVHEMNHLYPK